MVECREPTIGERERLACSTAPSIHSTTSQVLPPADCTIAISGSDADMTGSEGCCAECGEAIVDRFYLFALERRWHNSCLSCSICSRQLESEGSCYVKDGRIYCRDDYFRRFGVQKCCRCYDTIQSGQMVMRAQANVYHLKCFTCIICSTLLQTGDHFGVYADEIYCRSDFAQLQYNMDVAVSPPSLPFEPSRISCNPQSIDSMISSGPSTAPPSITVPSTNFEELSFGDYPPPLSHTNFIEQGSKCQRQKKRQRQHIDTNVGSEGWQLGINMGESDNSFHQNGSSQPQHIKQKRMRTSFKHHQLKVMKQYFTINHNPDAKDLKQLSHKTGLSKRVLQVWFQNARAKFRRGQGDCGKDGGHDNIINDDESNSNEEILSDAESQDLDSMTSGRSPSADTLHTSSPLPDLKTPNSLPMLDTLPPASNKVDGSDCTRQDSICI